MYNNNKKTQTIKKKSELGLDPPTHSRVFFGFLDFFNLIKPLNVALFTTRIGLWFLERLNLMIL